MQGLLLFYKPIDWRNKNILKFFQKTFGKDIKVGHSGTLDPFAEGLMVMGLGRKFTKQLHDLLLHSQKEYIAKIEFGKTSDTYDITGNVADYAKKSPNPLLKRGQGGLNPSKEEIIEAIKQEFLGEKIQIPPIYSAKKHHGRRLRDLAIDRENSVNSNILENSRIDENIKEILESKKKNVTLYDFEIISYKYPYLEIRLLVSSGYYIRSFGNSLGEKLKVGAYLTELKRTKLGEFSVKNALLPTDFNFPCHSELHEESQSIFPEPVEGQKSIELRGEIFGNVQGVGFRYFTKELAKKLAISGYIKNTYNNSVEFLAQIAPFKKGGEGDLSPLEKFQTEILQPPAPIEISDYKFVIQKSNQTYTDFKIL